MPDLNEQGGDDPLRLAAVDANVSPAKELPSGRELAGKLLLAVSRIASQCGESEADIVNWLTDQSGLSKMMIATAVRTTTPGPIREVTHGHCPVCSAEIEFHPPLTKALHGDDLAVDRFAAAMKAKLAASRARGRSGWDDPQECTVEMLARMLVDHLPKGDPVDVANFAMMLHQRCAGTDALAAAFVGRTNTPPAPMSPKAVWLALMEVLDADNGGVHDWTTADMHEALQPITHLQKLGFFADDPHDLDGSFWQCASGEETERRDFFARGIEHLDALDKVIDRVFDAADGAALPPWWDAFILSVCELPDRTSPEDDPEALIATIDELRRCALSAIEDELEKRS